MKNKFESLTKAMASLLGISPDTLLNNFQAATLDDLHDICNLRHQEFGCLVENDFDKMKWLYFHQPNTASKLYALKLNGEIVGSVGVKPIQVSVGNTKYNGIQAADIIVAQEYLQKGIGAWINSFLQNKYPMVIAMGTTQKSSSMVRRIFTPMNCRMYFKYMISSDSYLASRGIPQPIIVLARLFAWLPLRIRRLIHQSKFSNDYSLHTFYSADEVDKFIDTKNNNQTLSRVLKNKAFYNWRYDVNPISDFIYLAVFYKDVPAALCVLKSGKKSDKNDWYIMDWILIGNHYTEENLKKLFSAAVMFAAENGAESIGIMLSDVFSKIAAHESGFSHRSSDDEFYLYVNDTIDKAIFDDNNWFLTYADTDELL